jgi:hypothetical protein
VKASSSSSRRGDAPRALLDNWRFSASHLARALDSWEPNAAQLETFQQWAMAVIANGPGEATLPIPYEEDGYITWLPAADAFVVFRAVQQDNMIFVERIEGASTIP